MDFKALISRWLCENYPQILVERNTICLPISSKYINSTHVWYVCTIEDDHIRLFNPAKRKFGNTIPAGLPTFFEQFDAVIKFYGTYAP